MSYCVNCGVELAPSEKCCPLCGVEAVNPKKPWEEPEAYPYPKRVERIMSRVNRSYAAAIITVALMVPSAVCVIIDLLTGGGLYWSLFAAGAAVSIAVCACYALLSKKERTTGTVAVTGVALGCYLWLISALTGGDWFLGLGVPFTGIALVGTEMGVVICRSSRVSAVFRAALICFALAVDCLCVDVVINMYFSQTLTVFWSVFASASLAVIGILLMIVDRFTRLKEEIIRRLFV